MGWGRLVVLISLLFVIGIFLGSVSADDNSTSLDSPDSSDSISSEGGDSVLDSSSSTQPIEDSSQEESPSTDSFGSEDSSLDESDSAKGEETVEKKESDNFTSGSDQDNESLEDNSVVENVSEENLIEEKNDSFENLSLDENKTVEKKKEEKISSGNSGLTDSEIVIDENDSLVETEVKSSKIVVGEEVRWIKKVYVNANSSKKFKVKIPGYAKNVSVKKNSEAKNAEMEIDNSFKRKDVVKNKHKSITGGFLFEVKKKSTFFEDVFVYLKRFAMTGYFVSEANEKIKKNENDIEVTFEDDGFYVYF